MAADCPECGGVFMDGPHPNYDHVHGTTAERLPRARRTDGRVVTRGYAVGLSGFLPQVWVFFGRVEPAYAFGRAGRMASTGDITSYGVYEAAHEVRWDEDQGRDVRTLHVASDTSLREHADDKDLLTRWVRGTTPRSAYYQPPGGGRTLPSPSRASAHHRRRAARHKMPVEVACMPTRNASEVLRDGLRLVEQREARDAEKLKALCQAAAEGWADVAAGRYTDVAAPTRPGIRSSMPVTAAAPGSLSSIAADSSERASVPRRKRTRQCTSRALARSDVTGHDNFHLAKQTVTTVGAAVATSTDVPEHARR